MTEIVWAHLNVSIFISFYSKKLQILMSGFMSFNNHPLVLSYLSVILRCPYVCWVLCGPFYRLPVVQDLYILCKFVKNKEISQQQIASVCRVKCSSETRDYQVGLQPPPFHINPTYHCCAYFYDKKKNKKKQVEPLSWGSCNVSEAFAFALLILVDTECALRNAASSSPDTVNVK